MPRPLRLEFPDAWYHVMNRGAGHRTIYHSVKQHEIFLELLGEASALFGIEVHAYCLMDNHYHLLIKTPRANLARAMRHINGLYTQRYNRLEKSDGSVFRGRYKAIVIEGDAHLLQVSRYLHLNPLSAKITSSLERYRWSSYPSYLKAALKPAWLHTQELLSMVTAKDSKQGYKRFVEAGIDKETADFYQRGNTPVIFGTTLFKARLLKKVDGKKRKAATTDFKRTQVLPSLARIEQACAGYFKVRKKTLHRSRRGEQNEARKLALYGGQVWASAKLATLAEYYGYVSLSSVSNAIREIKQRLKTDKQLVKKIEQLRKEVFAE